MSNVGKHRVGELFFSASTMQIGMIVEYYPDGLPYANTFEYGVRHLDGNHFYYNEKMIDEGKEHLRDFYEREGG